MELQPYLCKFFTSWIPISPKVEEKTKRDVTLSWSSGPFHMLGDMMLYRVEMKSKIPPWIVVYSGGKTIKTIDNLPPRHPQQFRVKVILKDIAVQNLAETFVKHFGDEENVYKYLEKYQTNEEEFTDILKTDDADAKTEKKCEIGNGNGILKQKEADDKHDIELETNKGSIGDQPVTENLSNKKPRWLESQYSEETWISTEGDGTSAACFCMAVRGGYLKQVQQMLDERPGLIEAINSANGFTPLTTAVRKGDQNMVRFLLLAGADIEQRATSSQTPLHLATLAGHTAVVTLLLDRGADFQARDINDLRIEHYAVDSNCFEMVQLVFDRAGDVHVTDGNNWTPLFRAVCQGAKTEIIEELILRGSDLNAVDKAGLTLPIAAYLLKNRNGRCRESVIRLVDKQYPQQAVRAHFTRLTKKITNIHSLIK